LLSRATRSWCFSDRAFRTARDGRHPRQKSLIDALDEGDDMKKNIISAGGGMAGGGGMGI
jgi:hypothetical protein